ncbi:MAG TPA: PH domain-containing protein [Patescibacteria group bacterium]|nr:PH domain-containing protein [Patescibacteria group bacterium]
MNYEQYLSDDEKLKLVTGYSTIHLREIFLTKVFFPGFVFIILGALSSYLTSIKLWEGLLIGLIFSFIPALIITVIINNSHKYLLTTRRVIVKEGFFRINLASILFDKITHITVDQGFLERFVLGYGTLRIDTAGSSGDEITLMFVAEPIKLKNRLEDLIHKHAIAPVNKEKPKKVGKKLIHPLNF